MYLNLAIVLAIQFPGWVRGQQKPFATTGNEGPIISPELSRFVEKLREEENVPGLALGVVYEGRVAHGAWGRRSEDGADVTADTLFGLASCSKAFASAALGILMDDFGQGRNVTPLPGGVNTFDWYTKIADLLPGDWDLMDEWATKSAGIRDGLSHVSGIASHDHAHLREDSPLSVIRKMRYLRPSFELRQQWSYSNQFFMLAAELIKKYSGMTYVEFVQARIFDPARMNSTTFSATKAEGMGTLSQGWTRSGRRMPYWFPDNTSELVAGPMGIISNVVDMTKWLEVLLSGGKHPSTNASIIPPATLEEVTTPSTVMYKQPMDTGFSITGYGMGWARHSYYGHEFMWHFGGVPGVTTLVAFSPKNQLGIVVLVNASAKDKVTNAVAYRVADELLNIRVEKPVHAETSWWTRTYTTQIRVGDKSSSSTPPFTLETYAGTFTNEGYKAVTLCAPSSTSSDCPQVLAAFDNVGPISPSESHSNLYASFPGLWASHLRLTHSPEDGEHNFRAVFPYLFPNGYGENTTGFEMMEPGLSEAIFEFVFEGEGVTQRVVGIGMYLMLGVKSERQRLGGGVRETADVWWKPVY